MNQPPTKVSYYEGANRFHMENVTFGAPYASPAPSPPSTTRTSSTNVNTPSPQGTPDSTAVPRRRKPLSYPARGEYPFDDGPSPHPAERRYTKGNIRSPSPAENMPTARDAKENIRTPSPHDTLLPTASSAPQQWTHSTFAALSAKEHLKDCEATLTTLLSGHGLKLGQWKTQVGFKLSTKFASFDPTGRINQQIVLTISRKKKVFKQRPFKEKIKGIFSPYSVCLVVGHRAEILGRGAVVEDQVNTCNTESGLTESYEPEPSSEDSDGLNITLKGVAPFVDEEQGLGLETEMGFKLEMNTSKPRSRHGTLAFNNLYFRGPGNSWILSSGYTRVTTDQRSAIGVIKPKPTAGNDGPYEETLTKSTGLEHKKQARLNVGGPTRSGVVLGLSEASKEETSTAVKETIQRILFDRISTDRSVTTKHGCEGADKYFVGSDKEEASKLATIRLRPVDGNSYEAITVEAWSVWTLADTRVSKKMLPWMQRFMGLFKTSLLDEGLETHSVYANLVHYVKIEVPVTCIGAFDGRSHSQPIAMK